MTREEAEWMVEVEGIKRTLCVDMSMDTIEA